MPLPKAFRFRGLDVYNGHLSPAEQLAQHDDPRGLVFRFDAHARNDWGGHARDPMLLNVVLMSPRQPPANPERGFSIGRYSSPTGSTIALNDARWQQQREAVAGGERVWRWLEMNDHFGSDKAPRWAISVYEPSRALRLDLFVWRRMMSLDEARALLGRTLDAMAVHPSRDAHFQRPGTREDRLAVLREVRIAQFFDALAQAPLPPDAARDEQGRPQLALALQPAQGAGGPPQLPLRMLYWHADSGGWRYSALVRPTARDDWQLLDIERAVVARLPDRGSVYVVHPVHAYRPPVLDDAPEAAAGFLDHAERWRGELLAGRVLALPVQPVRLPGAAR